MKTYFFLLLIITCFNSFAQVNDDLSFLTNNYDKTVVKNNKIERIQVTYQLPNKQLKRTYTFDASGNLLHAVTTDDKGNQSSESSFVYNNQGQLMSRHDVEVNIDNNTTYTYNTSGLLDKTVKKNKEGKITVITYTYTNDLLSKEIKTEPTYKTITSYTYDTKDRLKEASTMAYDGQDTSGIETMHKKITYGSNGKIATEELTTLGSETTNYTYDANDNLVSAQKEQSTTEYFYNDKKLLSKKQISRKIANGTFNYSELYEYAIRN